MNEQIYDVVQVGYGPVGMMNATLLGEAGCTVAVFERHPTLYGLPRAGHFDHEAMRLFQSVGVADHMEETAVRAGRYVFKNKHGEELISFDWDGQGVSGWASDYYFFQPDLEDALDEVVRSTAGVELHQGYEAVAIEQLEDHVALTVRARGGDPQDERVVRARYLVAADGGSSFVRKALDVELEDLGFHERWLVVDYRLTQPVEFDFDNGQVSDPARPMNLFQLGKHHRRFAFLVLPHESTEEMSTEQASWDVIKSWGVLPENAEIVRHTVYTFESKIAMEWRRGRVLLVGDACHVMPPFMGQGLMSGLRDVANLSWKLARVVTGEADASLLDTYVAERRPHARRLTEMSIHAGRLMVTTDPAEAERRDEAYRQGTMPPPPEFPWLFAGLLHSDAEGAPIDPAGRLSPQGTVRVDGETGHFDDIMGLGWTLLLRHQELSGSLDPDRLRLLDAIGVRVAVVGSGMAIDDVDGVYDAYFQQYGVEAVLYRPDFYVFGGARTPDELGRLIDDLGRQLLGERSRARG